MFTNLIFKTVLKFVNIFSSLRIWAQNSNILALPWSCGIKSGYRPKSSPVFEQLFLSERDCMDNEAHLLFQRKLIRKDYLAEFPGATRAINHAQPYSTVRTNLDKM